MNSGTGSGSAGGFDLRTLAEQGPIHFMGIGGAGMSAIAQALVHAGAQVTGCDSHVAAARRTVGERIPVMSGHDPAHVEDAAAVVVTSAVAANHPELEAARARGIPVMKRAQALGALVNAGTVLAVAGTHGKTTTSAMTSAILDEAGLDPTAFVGGRVQSWGSGLRSGASQLFVVEADEYDRSFLTLQPDAVVVTSVEADHLDIYGDLETLHEAFRELLARVPSGGLIALCADDAGARALLPANDARVVGYGTARDARLRAADVVQAGSAVQFNVVRDGTEIGGLMLNVPGMHNVRNALAAIALALHAGADIDACRRALGKFSGVARRFQEVGTARGITVIDDYAHHPTEIAATLQAARAVHPHRRIVAAFQPHLYSRTRDLAAEFGAALAAADVIYVTDVYAAREQPIAGIDGALVADAARTAGASNVHYVESLDELQSALAGMLTGGDVLVGMGAGDIDGAVHALYAQLAEAA